jgi:type II secretory pathway component PulM
VKITAREKKFLIAGGVVALVVIAFYLSPMLLPQDLSGMVETEKNLLRRQREFISQEEVFKARIAQGQQRLAQDLDLLLPGNNPSAAGPALQKVLQDLADSLQVEISRKTILPEQKLPENLTKVTVQLDINCTLDQLVRFMTAIENYEKVLKIDELFIQSRRLQNRDQIYPMLKVAGLIATSAPVAKPVEKTADGK